MYSLLVSIDYEVSDGIICKNSCQFTIGIGIEKRNRMEKETFWNREANQTTQDHFYIPSFFLLFSQAFFVDLVLCCFLYEKRNKSEWKLSQI